ncbi:MAG: DUF1036 domain-containing protein [Cyanobacteria bacterium MAG CAR1_bin_15]|nr:DUF1036 domain-containing protein [Cyanobacteria bacterium MAG CAR1_bin_15]
MKSAAATILKNLFGKYQTSNQVKGEDFRLPLLKQGLTLAAGLSILMLIEMKPAQAELVFCNQSNEDISISTLRYRSNNEGMTATGWLTLDDNDCATRITGDLNQTVYFHVSTFSYSSYDTYSCVDRRVFEIVWDGDTNNPWYKDLELSNPEFKRCEDLPGDDYRVEGFKKVPNSDNWDHCVMAFGEGGSYSSECWDD